VTRGRGDVVVTVVAVIALAYGGICAALFFAQRSMIYYPVPGAPPPGAQTLSLTSGGETVRVWHRPAAGTQALIYFGGNAEDVGGNFAEFAAALPGRALYFVNYRGYGGSTGTPTEAGLFADALAVYDHVRAQHADVAVVGRSLGSGVAMYLAHERPVAKLVLVTPYDSLANVAGGLYPFLPVGLLMRDRFDSAARVADVRVPTLVVIAERDEVILRTRSDALVARFPAGQVHVEVVRDATHNALEYLALLAAFLERETERRVTS
jgi:uncharacterized protein